MSPNFSEARQQEAAPAKILAKRRDKLYDEHRESRLTGYTDSVSAAARGNTAVAGANGGAIPRVEHRPDAP